MSVPGVLFFGLSKFYIEVCQSKPVLLRLTVDAFQSLLSRFSLQGPISEFSLKPDQKLLSLPIDFFDGFGVVSPETINLKKVVLFLRKPCHDQIAFIKDRVIDKSVIGEIYGPPGTGKSIISYCCAALISREQGWKVIWLNICSDVRLSLSDVEVIIFAHGQKFRKTLEKDALFRSLSEMTPNPEHKILIVIDGFSDALASFETEVLNWLRRDETNRALLAITTRVTVNHAKKYCDMQKNIERFQQVSWKWEEYLDAIGFDELYENVADVLDSASDAITPLEKLRAKLFQWSNCIRRRV